jgi:hypothetical protein
METSERFGQGSIDRQGFNPSEDKPESNFWGIVVMILVFVSVIAVLAILLL